MLTAIQIATLTNHLCQVAKYRNTHRDTVTLVVTECAQRYKTLRQVEDAARERLHNIVAPYLGDPDYPQAILQLEEAFVQGETAVQAICRQLLSTHDSTRERLAALPEFYQELWKITGVPQRVLDLACALHPLALPWMQLPADVQFYGYDIHQERVALLNRFMQLAGRQPLVKMQDIAQVFPRESADVALFLKELPRFEKNYGNLGLPLLQSLSVRWIVLSFPAVSLHGGRSLRKHYSAYCERLLAPVGWSFVQLEMANELLFCIQKT